LRLSIVFINTPTFRASPRSVARVNQDQRNTCTLGFVGNLLSQVEETPRVVLSPLGLPNSYPFANALQILKRNPASGVFRPLYQLFGDPVIFLFCEALLFLASLLQKSFGRLRFLALQTLSDFGMAIAKSVDLTARIVVPITISGYVFYTKINSQIALYINWLRRLYITGGEQVKLAFDVTQVTLSALPTQQFKLSLACREGDTLTTVYRPDRHLFAFQLVGKDTVIERNRPVWLERALDFTVNFVSVCHFRNHADNDLGSQLEHIPHVSVGQFMQGKLSKGFVLPRLIAHIVAGSIRHFKSFTKCARLFRRRKEFDLSGKFHGLFSTLLSIDVLLDRCRAYVPGSANVVRTRPHVWQSALEFWKFFAQLVSRETFQPVHNLVGCKARRKTTKQVNVIRLDSQIQNFAAKFFCLLLKQLNKALGDISNKHLTAILRYPDEVVSDLVGRVSCSFVIHKLILSQEGGMRNSSPA